MLSRIACCAAIIVLVLGGPANAQMSTSAAHAVLMDYDTGEILFDHDGDTPMPPSSMSKLMTVELVFQRLKDHSLKLTDVFHVSEKAWREGADSSESKMFVMVGTDISVEDLLKGIIVQSGNDACVVVAEALGGTEEGFAKMMTRRAKQLGLTQSHFVNSTGMPDPGQYMSAHDLAVLAAYIIRTYPEYYPYFALQDFTWSGIHQPNRNPLLFDNIGADGLKTGHTDAGGYGLVGSAVRGGRRLILVVNGLTSERQRAEETRRLLEIGFRDFKRYDLFGTSDVVGQAEVWGGKEATVPLKLAAPLSITLQRAAREDMKVTLQYQAPVPAPIAAGQQIGTLTVTAPERPNKTVPVYAAAAVPETGIFGHIILGINALLGR
jgi:serine-type D-Ala-D-Ala carboxypeptidase (penicillin-binding protein 5/6)